VSDEVKGLLDSKFNAPPSDEALAAMAKDVESVVGGRCEVERDPQDPYVVHVMSAGPPDCGLPLTWWLP